MARKKSKRKKQTRKKKKSKNSLAIFNIIPKKTMLIALISALVISGIFFGCRQFFLNSNFFAVSKIEVNSGNGYSPTGIKPHLEKIYGGRNIFTVNLGQMETVIKKDFSGVRNCAVRKILPCILEVDIVTRESVAYIDYGKGVVVDAEGVVLGVGGKKKNLIMIKGIGLRWKTIRRGQKIEDKSLVEALMLVKEVRRKMRKDIRKMGYIDVSKLSNILLEIDGVQVKMGNGDFSRKISELKEIINDPNMRLEDINYIDLRFDDIVISPK